MSGPSLDPIAGDLGGGGDAFRFRNIPRGIDEEEDDNGGLLFGNGGGGAGDIGNEEEDLPPTPPAPPGGDGDDVRFGGGDGMRYRPRFRRFDDDDDIPEEIYQHMRPVPDHEQRLVVSRFRMMYIYVRRTAFVIAAISVMVLVLLYLQFELRDAAKQVKVVTYQYQTAKKHDFMKGPMDANYIHLFDPMEITYVDGGPMYLVILGHVFDVGHRSELYRKGTSYHAFIGRDASRAFITGDFSDGGATEDVTGLELSDYMGLKNWLEFYLRHDKYVFKGYLVGTYFDNFGKETQALLDVKEKIRKHQLEEYRENELKKEFPPCNVEWSQANGTRFWCEEKKVGEEPTFPRKFTDDKGERCACVGPSQFNDDRVSDYPGCGALVPECFRK